jgi:K+-sensing histidine kinase KdpD
VDQTHEKMTFFRATTKYGGGRRPQSLLLTREPLRWRCEKKACDELLDNAFKFSQVATHVMVSASAHEGEFVLTIADHSRGISPEQIAGLGAYVQFQRKFYEQEGAGLGFTIAKRLVEVHGGRVEFHPTSGGGLTVMIRLPIHPTE